MLTGNLATGPTGGDAWRRKLADRGMSPALIQILVSCLDEANDRIANAGVLCSRIDQALAPSKKGGPPIRPWVVAAVLAALVSGIFLYMATDMERPKVDPPSPPVAKADPPPAPSTILEVNKDVPSPDRPKRLVMPTPVVETPPPPQGNETLITNTLGMKLALIPAGEFFMGSDASDPDARMEEKVDGQKHKVRITKPFYLGTTEVTVGQFRQFVKLSGYTPKGEWQSPRFAPTDDHPVVNVSYDDGLALCAWLSNKEGQTYRLPTEAEWEYSCRAGQASRFWCGDGPEGLKTVGNAASSGAVPVGRYRANGFGLYDMHGNVWEWCADWHASDYYAESPPADPPGPSDSSNRVIRGGSWLDAAEFCRAAYRFRNAPTRTGSILGLRLARVH